jgi:acetoacetate decarboxylase
MLRQSFHSARLPPLCRSVAGYPRDPHALELKGAWTGPGALDLHAHALAPVAELPVLEVISATHIIADLTLGLGKVVHDYLR